MKAKRIPRHPVAEPVSQVVNKLDASKVCKRCHVEQDITRFYVHPDLADGHMSVCKLCHNADARQRRSMGPVKARRHAHREHFEKTGECLSCEGMSWRREHPRCRTCHEPYEAEDMAFSRQEIIERRRQLTWL